MAERLRVAPTAPALGLEPADVAEVPVEALPGLLAALAALQGAVAARLGGELIG